MRFLLLLYFFHNKFNESFLLPSHVLIFHSCHFLYSCLRSFDRNTRVSRDSIFTWELKNLDCFSFVGRISMLFEWKCTHPYSQSQLNLSAKKRRIQTRYLFNVRLSCNSNGHANVWPDISSRRRSFFSLIMILLVLYSCLLRTAKSLTRRERERKTQSVWVVGGDAEQLVLSTDTRGI